MDPAFRYPHWAGFSGNTHPFGLAAAYVFIKQSEPPGHCDLLFRGAGTPSPEVTGPVCRVPSGGLLRHALGYSPRGTCVSSRYGRHGPRPCTFHRHPESAEVSLKRETPSRLHPLLTITVLRGLQRLDSATALLGLSGCVMHGSIVHGGAGILTCFPFGVLQLGYALGPANPRLTNIAVEP